MDLCVTAYERGRYSVLEVAGELDVATSALLRDYLVDLEKADLHHVVVDLENVEFIDSTGLGVLVGALKRSRAHKGSLRLVCTRSRLLTIFRMTGLTKAFSIHPTVADATAG